MNKLDDCHTNVYYPPFGSVMSERTWEAQSGYRYGFQGQEKESSIIKDLLSFEYRLCNTNLGRFFSIDPILSEYPAIGSYTFCENRVIDGIDWEGLEWKDAEGNELTSDQLKQVKVYIFYVEDFKNQAMDEYNDAVALYGKDKVALSNPGTVENFEKDWKNMEGTPDLVVIDMHGMNQSLMVSDTDAPTEQVTSTGDGKTNKSGTAAKNVQDLPSPKANLLKCELQLNTCHSNDQEKSPHGDQGELRGSGKTLARAFQDRFSFKMTRCTAGAVNYHWPGGSDSREPYPENGKWDYIRSYIDSPIKPNKNEPSLDPPVDRT